MTAQLIIKLLAAHQLYLPQSKKCFQNKKVAFIVILQIALMLIYVI